MRKNSKGFTLIELLAVIVVLAIIALIATPIVLNLINDAKKGAAVQSANAYIKAAETAVMTAMIDPSKQFVLCSKYTVSGTELVGPAEEKCTKIVPKISGNAPANGGTITIGTDGAVSSANLEIDGFKDILYSASTGAYKKS